MTPFFVHFFWKHGLTLCYYVQTISPGLLSFSVLLLCVGVFTAQGRPHVCRQLPDCYSSRHRVCGFQHRWVIRCQRVNHGQWSQSPGRCRRCCQVPRCSSSPVSSDLKQKSLLDWCTVTCHFVVVVVYDVVMFLCSSSLQALAGFRLFDHLCDRKTRHAEAACGGLVVTAQLPSWHSLFLWRPGPRPAQTQSQLPQVPYRGQTGRKNSDFSIVWVCVCVLFPVESIRNIWNGKSSNADITHFHEWP